jgi:GNAT superfamily N-acetyltransferase
MLDYTLVSARATYRMPAPRDLPALVGLVQAFSRELGLAAATPEKVLTTVRELERNKHKGSLFVFEREGNLAGYAILILYWSNELGGTVLVVDELYVEPGQRAQGLAGDFIALVERVAPPDVVAIQVEARRGDRTANSFYRGLGFQETGRQVLSLPRKRV